MPIYSVCSEPWLLELSCPELVIMTKCKATTIMHISRKDSDTSCWRWRFQFYTRRLRSGYDPSQIQSGPVNLWLRYKKDGSHKLSAPYLVIVLLSLWRVFSHELRFFIHQVLLSASISTRSPGYSSYHAVAANSARWFHAAMLSGGIFGFRNKRNR